MKKKEPIKIKCANCGGDFHVQPYRKDTAKFCSIKCSNKIKSVSSAAHRGNIQRHRGSGKGYVKMGGRHQHRVVMEQKIGRKLLSSEVVHHIDGNKRNNHPDNLKLTNQPDHVRSHIKQMLAARKIKAGF